MRLFETQAIKSFLQLSLPLIASFLAQKGMTFIDTVMMGWIGPQALAAGALGTGIFLIVLVFCRGALGAIGIFIVHAKASNNHHEIESCIKQAVYLALLLSVPSMLIIWFSPAVLVLIKQNPLVVEDTKLLLHGLAWGLPGFLLFFVFREIAAAFSLSRIVMLVTLISLPLTAAFNYILIYGKYGLPTLGIAGIGYSGAIVMWLMFFFTLFYCKKQLKLKDFITFTFEKINIQKVKEMFYLGAPNGALIVLDTGMFLLAAVMMGYFGVIPLAAYQIVNQCASFAYNVPLAMSMVAALQVGHAVGAKDILQAKKAAYLALLMGLAASLALALIYIFMPEILIKLFINANENHYTLIVKFAVPFLIIAAFFQCFDAIQTIANGILRGFKDTLIPMLLCIPCYWILGIGGAYYFAFHTHLGANGIWYGLILGIFSASIVLMMRFFKILFHFFKLIDQSDSTPWQALPTTGDKSKSR